MPPLIKHSKQLIAHSQPRTGIEQGASALQVICYLLLAIPWLPPQIGSVKEKVAPLLG